MEAAKDLVEKLKEVIGAGGFVDAGIINNRNALVAQSRLLPVLDFYSEPQAQVNHLTCHTRAHLQPSKFW